MLDEKSVIPLYYQLKEILKEKIKDGTWQEGLKVPSERELMETFNVSRATVRKALSELLTEGLIFTKQGVGTFVSKRKVVQNLIGELSFNQQAIRQGLSPSSKVVYAKEITNLPDRVRKIFNITNDSDKVFKILRVRLVNQTPLILETTFIPYKCAPGLLEQDLDSIAVFEYLEKDCKIDFTHSKLDIEPILINEFEADYLDTELDKPALLLERVIYSGEKAIVIQKRIMRGDRGKLSLALGEGQHKIDDYFVGFEFN